MPEHPSYQFLANLVLMMHVAIVAFVVVGLVLVIVGNWRKWHWVNHIWFRLAHMAAIAVVVLEAWFSFTCPLTSFEMWLRAKANAVTYNGGFVEHWLQQILYYEAPPWVFVVGYSLFGLLVLATWWYFPPTRGHRRHERSS